MRLEGDAGGEGAGEARRAGGGGRRQPARRSSDVTPGARRALRRGQPARRRSTFSYRGDVRHARPLGRRAAVRALVRRRPRPRPRTRPGRSGSTGSTARPSSGPTARSRRPTASTRPTTCGADPMAYGEDEPGRRPASCVDATTAGWVVDQLGEEAVVERRPDGAVVVGAAGGRTAPRSARWVARPARPRRGAVAARAARRHGRRGSTRSWARRSASVEPVTARSSARGCSACSRSCRGSSRTRASPSTELADPVRGVGAPSSSATSSCSRCAGCRRTPPTGCIDVAVIDGARRDPTRRVLRASAAAHAGRGPRAARRRTGAARGARLRRRRPARHRARQARRRARRARRPRGRRRRQRPARTRCRTQPRPTSASRSTTTRSAATR